MPCKVPANGQPPDDPDEPLPMVLTEPGETLGCQAFIHTLATILARLAREADEGLSTERPASQR